MREIKHAEEEPVPKHFIAVPILDPRALQHRPAHLHQCRNVKTQPENPVTQITQHAMQIAKTRHFITARQDPAMQRPHIPPLPPARRQKDHATALQPATAPAQVYLHAEEAATDQAIANPD